MNYKTKKRRNILAKGGYSDITKTGPQTYRQLQQRIAKSFLDENSGLSPEERSFIEEHQDVIFHTPSSADTITPPITVELPEEFGKSKYDKIGNLHSLDDLNNLQDLRARNQSGISQIFNGLAKTIIYLGTAVVNNTAGAIDGIIEAFRVTKEQNKRTEGSNIFFGKPNLQKIQPGQLDAELGITKDNNSTSPELPEERNRSENYELMWKRVSKIWDNPVSQAMYDTQQWAENTFPNYRTREEQEDPWYKHILTPNFLVDDFVKNGAYTAAMIWSSKGVNAIPKIIRLVRGVEAASKVSKFTAILTGSLFGAMNEARDEALNNANDMRASSYQEYTDQITKKYDEEAQEIINQLQTEYDISPDLFQINEGVVISKDKMFEYRLNKALEELEIRKQAEIENIKNQIDRTAIQLGNTIMLTEIPLIAVTDAIAWGNVFSKGYTSHAVSKLVTKRLPKVIGAGFTIGAEALSEGGQEWAQDLISNISADYYGSMVDDYYTSGMDVYAREHSANIFEAFSRGLTNTWNDPNSDKAFFLGAATSLFGVFTPGMKVTRSGRRYLGLNWEGSAYHTGKEYYEHRKTLTDLENKATDRFEHNNAVQTLAEGFIRNVHYTAQQEISAEPNTPEETSNFFKKLLNRGHKNSKEILEEGSNQFNFENATHKKLLNLITVFSKLGRINDLKGGMSHLIDNLSDEDIDNLVKASTRIYDKEGNLINEQDIKGQEVIYDGAFVDTNGNQMSNDEIRQALQEKKQTIFNTIDHYRKIVKAVDLRYGGRLDVDALAHIAWMESQLNNWGERAQSMASNIKSVIKDALGIINNDIEAGQITIDNTEEGSEQRKKSTALLEGLKSIYDNLLKFDKLDEKALAQKLSLKRDKHGNLDNEAFTAIVNLHSILQRAREDGSLSDQINEDDFNTVLNQIRDVAIIGAYRQEYVRKLNEYLNIPTKEEQDRIDAQKRVQERQDRNAVKKIKDSLSKANSLKEFRDAVRKNTGNTGLLNRAIDELEKDGSVLAKNYKKTDAYRAAVTKAIDSSNMSDEEKQDAQTILNDNYDNASTIEELSSPEYRQAEAATRFNLINAGTTGLGKGSHAKFTDASGKEVTGVILDSDAERNGESGFIFANDSNPESPEFVSWKEAQRGKITNLQTPMEELARRYAKALSLLRNAKQEVNARDEWKDLFSTPQPDPGYQGNTADKTSSSVDGSDPINPVNPGIKPTEETKGIGITTPVGGESASKSEANRKRDTSNRGVETKINRDNQTRENNSRSENNRPYYRPAIPYHDLLMLLKHKVVPFIDAKTTLAGWNLIWNHLQNNGAFSFVDAGNLHVGDEIGFMIDPKYEAGKQTPQTDNEKAYRGNRNIPTIFMITKDGQIVGSLDESLTEKFQGLTELRQQIEEEYNKNKDKLGENDKFTSSLKTHVNKMMTGHLAYNYDESDPNKERSLANIPGVKDAESSAIFGIMKGNVLDTSGALQPSEVITPVGGEDGALYLMVPTGAGVYIPSRVTVAHFNREEYNLSDETVKSTPLGKRIDSLLRQLIPTVNEYGSSTNVTKEKVKEVLSNLNSVLFTRDIILNYEEKEDGIYLKFGHKVYDKNGNPVSTESGRTQLTSNVSIQIASKTDTGLNWRTDSENLFNEILDEFYSYNVPLQVSVHYINKSSGSNSYNERLISSGVLTSNLISAAQQGQGTWFTTNPIVNGKEIKGTAPKKAGPTSSEHQDATRSAAEANPVGGTDSANPRSWMPITSVNTGRVYNVDMNTGKIYDATGKEVELSDKNASLLRDLAKANQLYGDNTDGASMAGNIMIIEDTSSPYSVGSYRVLDRTTQTYLTGKEAQEVINKILGINPTQPIITTSEEGTPQTKNPAVKSSIYDNSIETLNPIDSSGKIVIDGKELPNGKIGYFVIKQDPNNPQDLGQVHKGVIYDLGEKGKTGLHVGIVKITTPQQVQADIGGGEVVTMEQNLDTYYAVFPNGETYAIVSNALTTDGEAARQAIERINSSSEGGTVQLSNTRTAITEFFENYKQETQSQESTEEETEISETPESAEESITPSTAENESQSSDAYSEAMRQIEEEEDEEFANYERKEEEKEATTVSPTVDGNTLNPDFVPKVGKEYGIDAVEALFNKEIGNSRGTRVTKALASKVFALARRLGLKIVFDNSLSVNNPGRYSGKGTITFSHRFFTRIQANDKANILLHEVIHACTQYVLSNKMKEELNKPRNKDLREAVNILNEVYSELKANKALLDQYGMKNVREMVAEMSNPEFRQALKKASIWEKFKAGIKRLLGIKTSDNNYTRISAALSTILDNYNPALYEAYVKANEVQEAEETSNLVRQQLKSDPSLVKFLNWYTTKPVINKRGEKETRVTKKGQRVERRIVDLVEGVSTEAGIDHLNNLITALVDDMFTYCKSIKTQIAPKRIRAQMAALIAQDEKAAKQLIHNINHLYPDALLQFHRDVSAYTDDELLIIKEVLQETLDSLRKKDIEEWQDKINELSVNGKVGEITPAEKYIIVTSLIQFYENTSEASLIKFLEPQIIATLNKMRERSSLDSPFNFYKSYVKTLGEGMGDPNTEVIEVKAKTGLSGKWVRINNKSISTDINQSVAKLQALSKGTNWCTTLSTNANYVLVRENRSFYCFIPDGQITAYVGVVPIKVGEDINELKGYYAGIFNKDQSIGNNAFDINALEAIETLCKETNDPNVKYTLESLGYSGLTKEEKEALEQKREALKQEQRKIFQGLKDKEEFSIEDAEDLNKLGFPVICHGNTIGLSALTMTIINNIKNLSSREKQDIINKLLHSPTFTFIEGDLKIGKKPESHSQIQDIGNLEYVGGDVILEGISISPKLKRIDGNVSLRTSDLVNIEYIGGSLNVEDSKLVSLGNLRYIGGSLLLPNTIESLGKLTYIGGDLNVNSSYGEKLFDFGELETVGGDLDISESSYRRDVNLKNLKRVGGYFTCSYIKCDAPHLEFVGKNCRIDRGNLESLRYIGGNAELGYISKYLYGAYDIRSADIPLNSLTYIGGDAILRTKTQKLDNLEFVGGFLSLEAPNVQKLHKDLTVEKALIFINPTKEQREDTFLEDLRRGSSTPIIGLNIGEIEQLKKILKLRKDLRQQLANEDYLSDVGAFDDDELLFKQEKKKREIIEAELKMADIWGIQHLKSVITGVTAEAINNQTWNNLSESTRQRLKEKGYNASMFRLPQEFVSHIMKCCGV